MHTPLRFFSLRPTIFVAAAAALLAGCADQTPLAPDADGASAVAHRRASEQTQAIATLRRVTARYHDLRAAEQDGFILLHPCENRPGEGPVGVVYYNPERLLDGKIDPESPDALIYEPPGRPGGRPKLVGVEFAIVDAGQPAPEFLGHAFQPEEEFGVYGLHIWAWRHNPEGMFAESNPRVSCGGESE
jgi:hypothetical protein